MAFNFKLNIFIKMTTITTVIIILVFLIVFLFIIQKNEPAVSSQTFQIYFNRKLGNYLVDRRSRALYYYGEDRIGTSKSQPKSHCGEGCLGVWQVFYEDKINVSPPLRKEDFSNLERHQDQQNQTVYKGHPLYYYINDLNEGDAKGEGMNNTWFVLKID